MSPLSAACSEPGAGLEGDAARTYLAPPAARALLLADAPEPERAARPRSSPPARARGRTPLLAVKAPRGGPGGTALPLPAPTGPSEGPAPPPRRANGPGRLPSGGRRGGAAEPMSPARRRRQDGPGGRPLPGRSAGRRPLVPVPPPGASARAALPGRPPFGCPAAASGSRAALPGDGGGANAP